MARVGGDEQFVSPEEYRLMLHGKLVTVIAVLACAALGACRNPDDPLDTPDTGDGRNLIRIQSDNGDVVGGGRNYEYTLANSVIRVDRGTGRYLFIEVMGDERWSMNFYVPGPGSRLREGTYVSPNAYDITVPRLAIRQISAGCEAPIGQFTISNLKFSPDSLVDAVDVTFEQRCPGVSAALRGTIHWRIDDPTKPPGPAPIPSSLWRPVPGATPSSGSYVYLASEPGDSVGRGRTYIYPLENPSAQLFNLDRTLIFTGPSDWDGRVEMPTSVVRAEVGYYTGLRGWPTFNPTRGGVQWTIQWRSCPVASAWLAIDGVTYSDTGSITKLDLRFELRCEGSAGVLHGVVHVSR